MGGRFVKYGPNDQLIDRGDMNLRARMISGLLRSVPGEGITTSDGIIDRKPSRKAPNLHIAQVVEDGSGVAGGTAANCTFKYDVFDFDNTEIGTALTPKFPRFPLCTYSKAPDDTFALVFTDPDDVMTLLFCFEEFPNEVVC